MSNGKRCGVDGTWAGASFANDWKPTSKRSCKGRNASWLRFAAPSGSLAAFAAVILLDLVIFSTSFSF
jgi:hypothetical protein